MVQKGLVHICALIAIVLDGTVESAPATEASSFVGVTIVGSTSHPFTAQQASDMAVVLSSGPLPVGFVAVSISTVTAR
jgi:preprotein translocase subunit SecD